MKRIYLDYAATTPLDSRVRAAMEPYGHEKFGNPGSLHHFGQEASAAVFAARRKVAESIRAEAKEIIFTSSATEANNLAVLGTVRAAREASYTNVHRKKRKPVSIIVAAIEHESVLEAARELAREGVTVHYVGVSREGLVNPKDIVGLLNETTVLISVGYVNSETGGIQPIKKIAESVKTFRESRGTRYPLFHTDAVQALPYLDCRVNTVGADFVTLSSHKAYGPKGAAALYARGFSHERGASHVQLIEPLMFGGGQEDALSPGTENVAAIVGFGEAVELAVKRGKADSERIGALRNEFLTKLKGVWSSASLNGPKIGPERIPGNVNIQLPGMPAAELLVRLDIEGIAASAGAACAARSPEPSHVLLAIGLGEKRAKESVRFTLGRETTQGDIAATIRVLKRIYQQL